MDIKKIFQYSLLILLFLVSYLFYNKYFTDDITKVENVPDSNNPRTSRLAILSAIETIRSICTSDIKIGT